MRQRESKEFAQLFTGQEKVITPQMIMQNLQKDTFQKCANYLIDVPHLFMQSFKVDEFNSKVNMAASGDKYIIKALDSIVAAN